MNVGVFSTHPLWPTHFETDLEILQNEIISGNDLHFFHCEKCLNFCEQVWNISIKRKINYRSVKANTCSECVHKQNVGLKLIEGNFKTHNLISVKQKKKTYTLNLNDIKSAHSLRNLKVDNFGVGWSILSSLISGYRDPFIQIEKHGAEINSFYEESCRMYFSAIEYIDRYKLDRLYVFNGRFAYTRAILDAANQKGIDCYVHERGSDPSKYSLFKNHTIHNISKFSENVQECWKKESDDFLKNNLANAFYHDRRKNLGGSWKSFLDHQDGSMPDEWDDLKHNIVLFTSSEDEFACISEEWDNPYFPSQLSGIQFVVDVISRIQGYHLYIRVHPNTISMAKQYIDSLNNFTRYMNVSVIEANSKISTYRLLDKCNKVITFGSTMSMEAVYWSRPSILLSKSLYFNLNGVYLPKDKLEITDFILKQDLEPKDRTDALKLGYFMKSFGVKYKYYQAINYKSGKFKDIDLNELRLPSPSLSKRIINRIKKILSWS